MISKLQAWGEIPKSGAACFTPGAHLMPLFFPERAEGQDNHGAEAKLICTGCPIRTTCLIEALRRNEEHGIWGGAGEQTRRTLRRAQAVGPDEFAAVFAAHFRRLDGVPDPGDSELLAGFGEGAAHGNPATYAKGCRCDPCCLAVAGRTAQAKYARPAGGELTDDDTALRNEILGISPQPEESP